MKSQGALHPLMAIEMALQGHFLPSRGGALAFSNGSSRVSVGRNAQTSVHTASTGEVQCPPPQYFNSATSKVRNKNLQLHKALSDFNWVILEYTLKTT